MSATTASTPTAAAPRLPSLSRLGWSRTVVELRLFFREGSAVVFIFAYPILMMGIFASVFDGQNIEFGTESISFAQYFLPGMIATGLMLTSFQSVATWIAGERDDGSLKRLRSTPLPPAAYFLGKVGLVLLTSVAQVADLLAISTAAFDVPLPTSTSAWATFAWTFLLSAACGTVLGIAYSSLIRSGRSATAYILPPVLVLQFISGVFFGFDTLPSWMQTIASLFPLRWMAESMRSVFLPDAAKVLEITGSWQHAMTAAVLVAWTIGGLIVAIRTFRWQRKA